ncbi:SulP family inorganic anion transporter [Pseudomonas cavernicola]|uniref:SulP family inorganic anion transporter n=1 Tax=Pseudomonas cavernicola TaxID=2320866 RepID=A0A418XED0_9PSED|nr:SulP family inorganic anion transporter [Pseudomonas cavernicola]RJG10876.1 SulP family inorganic anion transporter [Pseudomonas cavernicola]
MKQQGSEPHNRLHGSGAHGSRQHARGSVRLFALEWLRDYRQPWFRLDVIAGLTAAAVVIPKALAYATIAGLPVQVGLYTAFVPMLIYALFGTSRPLSVSTTTTIAILAGAALAEVSSGTPAALVTAAATLALLVGAILVLAGLLRLGFVANFISEPVLVGFKAGIGIVIVVDQIPKLLGIHIHKGSFIHNLLATFEGLPQASLPTVAMAVFTIAILLVMKRFAPRAPAPLVAVAIGIGAMSLFGLERFGVATVGVVPTGLPAVTLPDWQLLAQLWPAAMGIALMSFTETIAAGRAFAQSDEPTPQPNRELVATGLANIGGALLGAMPAGGGTTQTAVNRLAGARTQLAGLVTAALALGTILLLAPFIGLMPDATLAAVVIVYSVGLINPLEFREILTVRRTEFIWALVAMAGVVLLGTLQGIVVAIIVSLVALAYQVSDPPVHVLGRRPGSNVFRPRSDEHPEDESFPGLLMLRPEGRIFFANAERIGQKIQPLIAEASPKVMAFDLGGVFDLEYTALKMLTEAEKRLREKGVTLWLVGLNPGVLAMVKQSPLGQTLGLERMFFNLEEAVARYESAPAAV